MIRGERVLTDFNQRLKEILEKHSGMNRNAMIIRLMIMLKLNEMAYYHNCKSYVFDTRGKQLMEYLAEEQKKYIIQLEELSPGLPEELEDDFIELSGIMMKERMKGLSSERESGIVDTEPMNFSFVSEAVAVNSYMSIHSLTNGNDLDYLIMTLQKKNNELKLIRYLTDSLYDQNCSEFFIQILEDEREYHQLLTHNLNMLQNTGRWIGI